MTDVQVVSEPLVYDQQSRTSYYQDLLKARDHDAGAVERLARHEEQMRVEIPKLEKRARGELPDGTETRVDPNRTQGQGGYFAPPLWLNELFITQSRPGRVLANLVPTFPTPAGASSINLPRITSGTTTAAVPDLAALPSSDVTDASRTSVIVTIEGGSDWALQAFEQSPPGAYLDWAVFKDLTEAYDANLERQMISGTGPNTSLPNNGQLQGIDGMATGANAVVYTSTSPTFTGVYPLMGQAAGAIAAGRLMPPEIWMMTTARWATMGTSLDQSSSPIVGPSSERPETFAFSAPAVAEILGWPAYVNEGISSTLGAAGNQDEIIACRPSDLMLFEGAPRTAALVEPLSGTLGVRFVLRNYVGFITRHARSIATITGTGMVATTGSGTGGGGGGGALVGSKSNVNASATSITILAANPSRKRWSGYNDSTSIMYLDTTGGTASSTSFTTIVPSGGYFEGPLPVNAGAITAAWASATGAVRLTEWA